MAESKGFEPLEPVTVHFVSSEALSTTQPTLQYESSYHLFFKKTTYRKKELLPPFFYYYNYEMLFILFGRSPRSGNSIPQSSS